VRGNRPIRICMLVHNVYDRDARVRRYAEYLAMDGCLVDVICLAPESGRAETGHLGIRVFPLPMKRVRKEGLGHAFQWALATILMFLFLCRLDFRYQYDLVHIHNMPDFLVFCALLPRLRGCPVILDIHDPVPELAMSKLGLPRNHRLIRILALLERLCCLFSSHIITAAPTFKSVLIQRGEQPEKITVILNAADPRIFCFRPGERSRPIVPGSMILLYVGTVADRYGLDVCVRALPSLRTQIPGIRLEIVPKVREEGAALDEILHLAEELGVRDSIELVDPVPLEEMPNIMKQADAGIYPARRDCHMDLALSLKIPEMAQVGLPIVASRLTVLEELFGEDAIAFVPPGDCDAFAAKILELYRSPDMAHRLAQKALRRALSLGWEKQYSDYKSLIRRLLGESPDDPDLMRQ
jgi:glycosyltransferase involved in cell wall biosynthesis